MKKRVIGLLLALMLLMSLLPVGAMASGGESTAPTVVSGSAGSSNATELWVNGVSMPVDQDSTVTCDSGTASYDADSNTLTLDNAKITDAHRDGFGIFATGDLTISLSGASNISGSDIKDGIEVIGSLTINGSGSLTVTGSRFGIMVGSPNAANNLTISGNGVTVTANGNDSVGIAVEGSFSVDGSTVIGKSTGNSIIARSITVTGGSVTGDDGNVGISAGSITVEEGGSVSGTGTENGVFSDSITVTGGSVTGEGSQCGIQAGEITVSSEGIGDSIVSGSVSGTGTGNYSQGISSTIITVNSGGSVTGTGTGNSSEGISTSSLTVTGGSVSGTGSSTGISVYYDDENDAAITISSGGSVTATSTTAGRGIYAPGMNISIDNTSTLTASAKFGGSAVVCDTIYVNEIEYAPEEKEKFTVANGEGVWEEVEREITLYVNGENIIAAQNNTVNFGNGGTATYDTQTKVLTLNNAEITSAHDGYGIYTDYNLTIELEGSSTISGNSITNGIKVAGDLTINGSGSLETTGSSAGISASGSLSIDGASTVTASSTSGGTPVSCSSISVAGEACEPVTGATIFKAERGVATWITSTSTLYVNGVDVLNAADKSVACGEGGTATYDPSTNTLTLTNAIITTEHTTTVHGNNISYGIYADGDLTIILSGESTVNNEGNSFTYGVYASGSLTITGDGSLEATGSGVGISAAGPLKVIGEGTSVTGKGTGYGNGIYTDSGMTVEGSTVYACGYYGMSSYGGNIEVNGGKVTAEGGNYGIHANYELIVTGGSVSATSDWQGISVLFLDVNGGSVEGTANGSLENDTGTFLGIKAKQGMRIQNGSVTGIASSAGTCYGLSTNGGSVYIDNYSTVIARSYHGSATDFSSFTVGDTAYTLPEDATEFKVVNGVVIEPATEPEDVLYVNGVNILKATGNTVTCDEGGTATYDPATNTLTLSGANITETYQQYEGLGIFAKGDLNIELVGTSTVGSDQLGASVYIGGNLTISGTGSLEATGARNVAGFYVCNNMTVNSGTVIGNNSSDREGIYVSGDMIVNSGGIVRGTSAESSGVYAGTLTVKGGNVDGTGGYDGINAENSITVYDGTVSGIGKNGIFSAYMTVNGGTVSGTGTGTGTGWGVYSYALTMTGGTVTGEGENAAIAGISVDSVEASAIIKLPAGYLPEGYELQTATYDSYTCVSIVPTDAELGFDEDNIAFIGAAKEVTLKDWQGENPEQPVDPGTDPVPPKSLYVDGKDILADPDNTVECGGGEAVYASGTLTLSGANITEPYLIGEDYTFSYGIYADGDLTINLVGNSTVGGESRFNCGVYIGGSLTVTGSGSLTVTCGDPAIYVTDDLVVNSGSIDATGTNFGIYVHNGDMTVNGGSVTGTSLNKGIQISDGDMTVTDGSVTGNGHGEGINGTGIDAENLTVEDGTVNGNGNDYGISIYNIMTVNGGTVTGTGNLGIYVIGHMAVNDGEVVGNGTGTGTGTGWGVYSYGLTMTGGTVTGKGENAAIAGFSYDSVEASEIINLPEGYLPAGYELQHLAVTEGSYTFTCETIVQIGDDFYIDAESGDFVGAATEVTLKDWQGEDTEQPTTPTDPTTPIIPTVPTTPGKDASQQAVDKIESAQGGETVSVDLTTGKAELDKEVFEELSGKDTTLEVKVPGGVTWTVNGKDIPADADLTDLDLSVDMDTKTIPEEVINSVNSEAGTVQLTVKNDGEFGFTMTLTAPVGAKNAGMWANLYQYDEAAGKMVYQASALVDRNGYASLPVGSAGQYAIVLDSKSHALPFTDLAAGAWYEDAVAYVYRHDLMSGFSEDLFGPNADLSRAQLCQILYNMEGRPAVTGGSSFSDLADGAWYTDAVTWAASQGIVDGYGGGLFGPDDNITREQLASILYRYAQARGDDVSVGEDTNILSYSDAADVAEYAISAMQWACGAGVITGISESALAPRGEATRAQTAAMLMRFCEQYVEW